MIDNELSRLLSMSDADVMEFLHRRIDHLYSEVCHGWPNFLYAVGDIPMCLMAHIDTVRMPRVDNVKLTYRDGVIRNKNGVLGADDRAGVYAILRLLDRCKPALPSVLLTNYEESGGAGALAWLDSDVWCGDDTLFIQLDRRGHSDFVEYTHRLPDEIRSYVESFGFVEASGSFSDSLLVSDGLDVPSVNLSVGFYNEHSASEYLIVSDLESTIRRVFKMLENPVKESVGLLPVRTEDDCPFGLMMACSDCTYLVNMEDTMYCAADFSLRRLVY